MLGAGDVSIERRLRMTNSEPGLGSSVLAYTGYYLGLAVLLNIVLWVSETYAGVVISSSAVGWMPPIMGAMAAGQRYGKLAGRKASGGYAWAASFGFLVVSVLLSVGLLAGFAVYLGIDMMAEIKLAVKDLARDQISLIIIAPVLGGFLLLLWVLMRFGFNYGAGLSVKAVKL